MNMNLKQLAQSLTEYWSPRVVGVINDQYVKVAKIKGNLVWHKHDKEDELFIILKGSLRIEYEDQDDVELSEGDFHVVPKGRMHNPVCIEECLVALIEPISTKHTGDLIVDRTVSIKDQVSIYAKDTKA